MLLSNKSDSVADIVKIAQKMYECFSSFLVLVMVMFIFLFV